MNPGRTKPALPDWLMLGQSLANSSTDTSLAVGDHNMAGKRLAHGGQF